MVAMTLPTRGLLPGSPSNLRGIFMAFLRPKNWSDFQHYKDRSPAWIKLHRGILDDYDYACLPTASRALAPVLWLLASQYDDGNIPAETARIAHRLRWDESELISALIPLIEKGFFIDASGVLAACYQDACLEEEIEIEIEEEKATVQPAAAQRATSVHFERFWTAYPNKKGKKDAERHWKREGCDAVADDLIAHVRLMMQQDDGWRRGYSPMGSTYLNGRRWEDIPLGPPKDRLSKSAQAMIALEGLGNGLDGSGSQNGFPEIDLSRTGAPARIGSFGRNGNGVGGGT